MVEQHGLIKYVVSSVLLDRVKELKKAVQRGVVTRVVEDFMEADEPARALDAALDAEQGTPSQLSI